MAAPDTPAAAAGADVNAADAAANAGDPAAEATEAALPSPAVAPRRPPLHVPLIIAMVCAFSMMKGLRMPNLWSATHMIFNYSQGFIRRGLFGQILSLGPASLHHYNALALIAVILFVLATLAMGRLIRRVLAADGDDLGFPAMALVFVASPGLVFLAHEIGYLDYVGLIAVPLFIVWASRTRHQWAIFYVAAAISVALALIHESMVIMFAPTMWLVIAAHIARLAATERLARGTLALLIVHAALVVLLGMVASSVVGTLGTKTPAQINALMQSLGRQVNFPMRLDGFEALYRPVRDNVFRLMPWYWSHDTSQRYLTAGLAVSLPGLFVLSAYAFRLIARLPLRRPARLVLWVLFLTATFSPQLLNFVGWDSARWNAICFVASLSCIAALRLFFVARPPAGLPAGLHTMLGAADPRRFRVAGPATLVGAAVAIVVGLTANYPGFLFDGYVVQWFPFDGQIRNLMELWDSGFHFIPRG